MDAFGREEYFRITEKLGPANSRTMEETFLLVQKFNWRFRFFKRELTSLVNADAVLKRMFVRTHRGMLALIRTSLDQSMERGLLRALPDEDRQLLTEEIWLVTLFWPNYVEVSGQRVTEASLRRGVTLLKRILTPYLTVPA